MGYDRKPWLDYKGSLAKAKKAERLREIESRKRSFGWALFWLVFLGFIGAHKFYVGQKRKGWVFVIVYLIMCVVLDGVIGSYETYMYGQIVFFLYGVSIIILSYRPLKRDVENINGSLRTGREIND